MKPVGYILRKSHLQLHLVFCLIVLAGLLLGLYLFYLSGFRFNNLVSAITDCFFFLLCIYAGRWLCARWYLKGSVGQFVLVTPVVVAGLSLAKFLLVKYAFSHPYAGFLEMVRDVMPFFLVGLIMGVALKLITAAVRKELEDSEAQTRKVQSEFNQLQAQLSPHFLFNVLNTVYGISLTDGSRVPALLLQLSSLLRYSVYSSKHTFVPLRDELEYLRNYIEFEKIRMSDRLELLTDVVATPDPGIKIAPLVLIVFVENAFKFAKNTLFEKSFINISVKIDTGTIRFSVSNSYLERQGAFDGQEPGNGIGLANTKRRLELLYGAGYELTQRADKDLYHVTLNLRIVYG